MSTARTRLAPLAALLLTAACPQPDAPVATTTTVQVTSTPKGLKVWFDGKELEGVTPLEIRGVQAFEAHTVEVVKPGQPNWTRRIAPAAGVKTLLRAEFKADAAQPVAPGAEAEVDSGAPAAPAAPVAPGVDAGLPPAEVDAGAPAAAVAPPAVVPAAPGGVDAGADGGVKDPLHDTWPVTRIDIPAKEAAFWLPGTGGIEVNLNPKKTYRLWTEGYASTRKGTKTSSVMYYLEGATVQTDEAMGEITVAPKSVSKASKMWVFAFDDDATDNSGVLKVYVSEGKYAAPVKVLWNAAEHVVVPDPEKVYRLDGLDARRTYTFKMVDPELRMREEPYGRLHRVVCRLDGLVPPARWEVYKANNTSVTVDGITRMACFFPDVSAEPNTGTMIVNFFNAP